MMQKYKISTLHPKKTHLNNKKQPSKQRWKVVDNTKSHFFGTKLSYVRSSK